MITFIYAQSHLSTAALVFYTCVWIPFLELKRAVLKILGFIFFFTVDHNDMPPQLTLHLPAARFGDLKLYGAEAEEAPLCSICLVEMEKEDVVSRLPKCCHVFHMNCIEKWLERDQFTCPLCRTFLLNSLNSSLIKCS
ncbi:hypothetical protein SLA2020_358750 [Shorea laevis]